MKLCDGWHGNRLTAEAAPPVIKRFRAARPDKAFTISLRIRFDGEERAELSARLVAYGDASVDHILVSPEDREIDDWMRGGKDRPRGGVH